MAAMASWKVHSACEVGLLRGITMGRGFNADIACDGESNNVLHAGELVKGFGIQGRFAKLDFRIVMAL